MREEELLETLKKFEKNDEFFNVMARLMKKNYEALINVGFDKDQATKIVATQGIGVRKQ